MSENKTNNEAKKTKRQSSFKKGLDIFLFLLPAILLFVGILIAPIAVSIYRSFQKWNGFTTGEFIGFKNYVDLFTSGSVSGRWTTSLKNALVIAFFSVFVQLPFSLFLALLLGRKYKGERFFLTVYFMPVLISTVVIGQLWLKIYNPDYGILNRALGALGLESWQHIWVGDPKTALGSVVVPTIWQYIGYHMLLMYAGVKGVSPDLREAAMLDGATNWQVDRYVVIPIIKPIIRTSVIFAVTGSLKSYDLVRIITNAGPTHKTEVPSTMLEDMLFLSNKFGMGSAISVMLIILCFAFALAITAAFKERSE